MQKPGKFLLDKKNTFKNASFPLIVPLLDLKKKQEIKCYVLVIGGLKAFCYLRLVCPLI